MWEPSGYVQDHWRATPNLMIIIGIRYDLYTPVYAAHNRYANFDLPSLTLVTWTMDPNVGIRSKKTNVAPRIDFLQSLGAHTALRGGVSMSCYPVQSNLYPVGKPAEFVSQRMHRGARFLRRWWIGIYVERGVPGIRALIQAHRVVVGAGRSSHRADILVSKYSFLSTTAYAAWHGDRR